MKGGIAAVLSAIKALHALDHVPQRPIWALFTTDEETGSHHSADYLRAVAQEAGVVLVPELPTPDEGLKTARKGVGTFYVTAHGKSAHAGNEPEKGVNAVVEIARQVEAIAALSDFERGTTVTPTVIQSGAATNVVPDQATLAVDVRASRAEERARVERAMAGLAPALPGATLDVRGGFNRPPMVRDGVMIATFQQAAAIAARVGCRRSPKVRPVAAQTATSPPRWASRRSTGLGRPGPARTPHTNTSSCRAWRGARR
ncbi:MAG: M20/M25/M40 family metallo-hydrolase [Anaerolineae bacterium]|nr:M20/M25/M40 family metallo-hydrolase [Anaerolineae bacterium]